jgi:hypothetical protein
VAANAWKAVALLLDKGLSALPVHSGWAMLVAAMAGLALPVINRRFKDSKYNVWIPSASSFGLAFIIAPSESLTLFYGTLLVAYWEHKSPVTCDGLAKEGCSAMTDVA